MTRVDLIRWRCCLCRRRFTARSEVDADRDQINHARSAHSDVWYGPKRDTAMPSGQPASRGVR